MLAENHGGSTTGSALGSVTGSALESVTGSVLVGAESVLG